MDLKILSFKNQRRERPAAPAKHLRLAGSRFQADAHPAWALRAARCGGAEAASPGAPEDGAARERHEQPGTAPEARALPGARLPRPKELRRNWKMRLGGGERERGERLQAARQVQVEDPLSPLRDSPSALPSSSEIPRGSYSWRKYNNHTLTQPSDRLP